MTSDSQYVSCIKICGKPIIPPLITQKLREECLKYKIQAIELEKKKERDRLFKKCMEDLARLETHTKDLKNFNEKPVYVTLENQLTFDDEKKSPSHVPYATYKKLRNLTRETIDVTEYSNEGVKMINKSSNSSVNEAKTPPPKLIRSNSYTLDSPSPILLAHLEKEAKKCVQIDDCEESRSISPVTIIDSESEPKLLIETDISLQEVTVTTPNENSDTKKVDLEPQLQSLLENLPKDHADNIIKILEKQQEESLKNKQLAEEILNDKPISVSISSQSLYYSIMSSPETPLPTSNEPFDTPEDLNMVNLKNIKNTKLDMRDWAASVIGAAARGYLVRRLIRTEKVQSLIETIKDALLCAIQLHGSEIIEEADVELHRRLIQQVSAACYAFHDVFFSLSVKEQMGIIALDRERRKEKANRPLSASSSSLSLQRRSSKVIR